MKFTRFAFSLFPILCLLLAVCGCQSLLGGLEDKPLGQSGDLEFIQETVLPVGAALDSAIFYIYIPGPTGETVYIHHILSEWDEDEVTYDNSGSDFAATPDLSFVPDTYGWNAINISDLIIRWMNLSLPNFGFCMRQDDDSLIRTTYYSSDQTGFEPYLEVYYTEPNGSFCETLLPDADTFTWEPTPTSNWGTIPKLYTGQKYEGYGIKQSLLEFDVPEFAPERTGPGCTRTRNYWRRHCGYHAKPELVSAQLRNQCHQPSHGPAVGRETEPCELGRRHRHSRNPGGRGYFPERSRTQRLGELCPLGETPGEKVEKGIAALQPRRHRPWPLRLEILLRELAGEESGILRAPPHFFLVAATRSSVRGCSTPSPISPVWLPGEVLFE
jgi:hypothetical protein